MAYLTIAGQDIDVQITGAERPENIYIGGESRAFAGNLRSAVRAEKRVWERKTGPMLAAARNTFRANIANGAFVTVTGILMDGASVTCRVRIVREAQIADASDVTIYQSVYDLHIEEV